MSKKIVIGNRDNLVRFSFCNVLEPKAFAEGGEEKYSMHILIPKTAEDLLDLIDEAIDEVHEEGAEDRGQKWADHKKFKWPLKDGDEEKPDLEEYADHYYLAASSKSDKPAPQVVGVDPKQRLTTEEEFYSGCYGRVSVRFFDYDAGANRGIGVALVNIQKIDDGERLGGNVSAETEFSDGEFDGYHPVPGMDDDDEEEAPTRPNIPKRGSERRGRR